jgi:hypothetical protein
MSKSSKGTVMKTGYTQRCQFIIAWKGRFGVQMGSCVPFDLEAYLGSETIRDSTQEIIL